MRPFRIALLIAGYLAAPYVVHALMRPLAISCHPAVSTTRRGAFAVQSCEFGLPEPAETVVNLLASQSHTGLFVGFFIIGFVIFGVVCMRNEISRVREGSATAAEVAVELVGGGALVALICGAIWMLA